MTPDADDPDETAIQEIMRNRPRLRRPAERTFEQVHDEDLVTIMERLCGSLEYHSMNTASHVMDEIDMRELWPVVIQRRAYLLRLRNRGLTESDATEQAALHVARFRDEHFPVPPHGQAKDEAEAAAWNGYLQ
ncbi:hypothetical protein [Microbacterium maritypicum]|uniref:Uncharacterized protein n=1 Tax=Microbacterium maritypicum TaxID=33918 RepID=A0A4Y4B704_MICMQ|nr:hypothetical protein [Microbacterium liquefaciens]GEC74727.1 hypothetical protein MLI01_08720 [Microbacterium liquefaciens]GGV51686.1 hypothetical protein GCM10010213_07010 [Microbacterium liquefaciens]